MKDKVGNDFPIRVKESTLKRGGAAEIEGRPHSWKTANFLRAFWRENRRKRKKTERVQRRKRTTS